ncbi:MAG: phosphotransferase [Chitinophagaceae bacterium]
MNILPVINSTLSPDAIAVFVKNVYKLGAVVSARILKTGISHTYLIIDEDGQYVFRVYSLNWRTEKEIEEELRLLNLLKENRLPVSYPIADVQGGYIQPLVAPEGLRFGVMFSFAKGEKMLNMPAELHYKIGEIMANLHKVTQDTRLERVHYTADVLLTRSFEQLKQFLPADTEEMIYMQSLQKYLQEAFSAADTKKLRTGIVHLDIWFDNMSVSDSGDITLFDFDFCGNGWLLLDIAYYLLQLHSTEKDEHECLQKKDSFIKGYESVAIISEEEKRLLPAAGVSLYFFYLGVQCSRYNNWSNVFLNELYLRRFINLLVKKWADYHNFQIN